MYHQIVSWLQFVEGHVHANAECRDASRPSAFVLTQYVQDWAGLGDCTRLGTSLPKHQTFARLAPRMPLSAEHATLCER